jgi:hypothetical protein
VARFFGISQQIPPNPPFSKGGTGCYPPLAKGGRGDFDSNPLHHVTILAAFGVLRHFPNVRPGRTHRCPPTLWDGRLCPSSSGAGCAGHLPGEGRGPWAVAARAATMAGTAHSTILAPTGGARALRFCPRSQGSAWECMPGGSASHQRQRIHYSMGTRSRPGRARHVRPRQPSVSMFEQKRDAPIQACGVSADSS